MLNTRLIERWHEPCFEFLIHACLDETDLMVLDSSNTLSGAEPYTYLCFRSFAKLRVKSGQVSWNGEVLLGVCPWIFLQTQLRRYYQQADPALPPFQGGAVGFWGYELAHTLESFPQVPDAIQFPDCALNFYASVVVYDHRSQEVIATATGLPEDSAQARKRLARAELSRIKEQLKRPLGHSKGLREGVVLPSNEGRGSQNRGSNGSHPITSNFTPATYCQAVSSMQDFIKEGNIFQANFTQQFQTTLPADVNRLAWYLRIRTQNPAPFSAYMQLAEDEWLLACSPERFVRLQQGEVQTQPIKGTTKRDRHDKPRDEQIQMALLNSKKDISENVMIVDLMRNDLSRVCLPGTVKVTALCALQTFETVHHLVSTIKGRLAPDYHAIDLLKATFPPGSVTGAPKLKAMEHISQLEGRARGPYCGCLGYLSFSGDMDTAVTIRTYVVKGNRVFFSAGGAVVLASHPEEEYEESLVKAEKLIAMLGERSIGR